ncbi:hypothetical protein BDQ17DRAFT_1385424 [Cyathus striatus]|nr:hypothetical protein BDQ17DRAFT_1385424 [Cyathus striatus]
MFSISLGFRLAPFLSSLFHFPPLYMYIVHGAYASMSILLVPRRSTYVTVGASPWLHLPYFPMREPRLGTLYM